MRTFDLPYRICFILAQDGPGIREYMGIFNRGPGFSRISISWESYFTLSGSETGCPAHLFSARVPLTVGVVSHWTIGTKRSAKQTEHVEVRIDTRETPITVVKFECLAFKPANWSK